MRKGNEWWRFLVTLAAGFIAVGVGLGALMTLGCLIAAPFTTADCGQAIAGTWVAVGAWCFLIVGGSALASVATWMTEEWS